MFLIIISVSSIDHSKAPTLASMSLVFRIVAEFVGKYKFEEWSLSNIFTVGNFSLRFRTNNIDVFVDDVLLLLLKL